MTQDPLCCVASSLRNMKILYFHKLFVTRRKNAMHRNAMIEFESILVFATSVSTNVTQRKQAFASYCEPGLTLHYWHNLHEVWPHRYDHGSYELPQYLHKV